MLPAGGRPPELLRWCNVLATQDYPLLGGSRTAIYTWHGCKVQVGKCARLENFLLLSLSVQVSGPTVQEYDAPNVVMRDYLCCADTLLTGGCLANVQRNIEVPMWKLPEPFFQLLQMKLCVR